MHDIIIRNARPIDAPIVYNFLCLLEETTINRVDFQAIYEQNIGNPSIYYLIAEHVTHGVVGFASCHIQLLLHHCGKVGEIQELYVRADLRNQGVGQRFIETFKSIAFHDALISLEVTTNQKRVDAIRFYKREHFKLSHLKLVYTIPYIEKALTT